MLRVILSHRTILEITEEDAKRAVELLRIAGTVSGTPSVTIHAVGVVDALAAAVAERIQSDGTIFTSDLTHMYLLMSVGARIRPATVPFG